MVKDYNCFYCFVDSFGKLIEKQQLSTEQKEEFTQFMAQLAADLQVYTIPEISTELYRKLKQLSATENMYAAEKKHSNQKALELAARWLPQIRQSETPFDLAIRLAIAGNIMDYGISNNFDIEKNIDYVLSRSFAKDHSTQLQNDINNAKQILYLGDNAGEIVFDKMFIQHINHPNLYFAVRGFPVINDVTIQDAEELKMNEVAKVISNGYDAPSTIIEKCSPEFQKIWDSSDLIISKGQGNLEGLLDNKSKNIYFLLMVKCHVIASHLGVAKGDFVVYNQSISQ